MSSNHSLEIFAVLAIYFLVFLVVVGPAVESVTGFESLSYTEATGGAERAWELVSKPQGWLLCLGYVPTHFAYLFVRARLAGESADDYWE